MKEKIKYKVGNEKQVFAGIIFTNLRKKVYLDEMSKDEIVREAYELLKRKKQLLNILASVTTLYCKGCKHFFRVDKEYEGVITCPYCGDYVEG